MIIRREAASCLVVLKIFFEKNRNKYLLEVEDYLNELAYLLFQKECFGFIESSFNYVDKIVDFIKYLPGFPV